VKKQHQRCNPNRNPNFDRRESIAVGTFLRGLKLCFLFGLDLCYIFFAELSAATRPQGRQERVETNTKANDSQHILLKLGGLAI
jgi:hypothetical protein